MVDDDEARASGGEGSPSHAGRVTDLSSGKEMTIEEFDEALGLHSVLKVSLGF